MEEKIIVNIEETIRNMFKEYFNGKAANVSIVDGKLQVQTYDDFYFDKKELTLISSTPYVTSDEDFNLTAILVNTEGVGVSGEKVVLTGSDGTEYSGITDNQGMLIFMINSISEDTTFTATYKDLTSSCTVELILFNDAGLASNYNDIWYLQGCSIDRQEDGTQFIHPIPHGYGSVQLSSDVLGTSALILDSNTEYEIIVDILDYTYSIFKVGLFNPDSPCEFNMNELSFTKGATLKIRVTTETIIFLVNDVVKKEVENDYNYYNMPYTFEMLLQGTGAAVKIKDFRIKEIRD